MGALNYLDRMALKKAGFIPYEIDKFDSAKTPKGHTQFIDLTKEPWQAAMKSRNKFVQDRLAKKWKAEQIHDAIMRFYSGKERDPFAWLKLEYKPPRKLTDFAFAVRQRTLRSGYTKSLGQYLRGSAPSQVAGRKVLHNG